MRNTQSEGMENRKNSVIKKKNIEIFAFGKQPFYVFYFYSWRSGQD